MSEELLPCPFCGGKADKLFIANRSVECQDCKAQTKFYAAQEEAIKAWNTRPHSNQYRYEEYADFAGQPPAVSKVGMGAFVSYDMAKIAFNAAREKG